MRPATLALLRYSDDLAERPSYRRVLRALASRFDRHPVAWGGLYSLSAAVERSTGRQYHPRTIQRATAQAVADGLLRSVGSRDGGRQHAAEYAPGPLLERLIAALRSTIRELRNKVRHFRRTTRSLTAPLPVREEEERLRRGLTRSRSARDAPIPPLPRPEATAPPDEVIEGPYGRRVRDLFPAL